MKRIKYLLALLIAFLPNVVNAYNLEYVACGNAEGIPAPVPQLISICYTLLVVATPIILIIFSIVALVKAITGGKADAIQKAKDKVIKKFISAALVFFVASIVQFVVSRASTTDGDKNSAVDCINCMLYNDGCAPSTAGDDAYQANKRPGQGEQQEPNPSGNNDDNSQSDQKPSTSTDKNKTHITSIDKDGILITVNAKVVDDSVSGYYFSYSSNKPTKEDGYLSTSNTNVDVVRLPGTTYVWVEDSNGNINGPETVTISSSSIINTKGTIIKGKTLSTVLTEKGSSTTEFNKLIARSVRAAGLYTPEAAATAAVTLVGVLDQEYNIRLPYRVGGKNNFYGVSGIWGQKISDTEFRGFDCDGFTHWSYWNAGMKLDLSREHNYWYWDRIPFSKEEGEIGDIISQYVPNNHVKIIVGKTDTGFIVAHANGTSAGVWINVHPYSDTENFTIIKGSKIASYYEKDSNPPTGF